MHTYSQFKSYQEYSPTEKKAAQNLGSFILKYRDDLNRDKNIERIKIKIEQEKNGAEIYDVKDLPLIASGVFGSVYPIKYGNNNNNAVIKVGIIPDEEAFFAKWIPKSCFLRANEVVKDANGDIALIFPKALSDDKYLKNIADKNKKYTEKIHLTLVHFKIKTLITGIKYNFSHNDLNTGNLLIMEDGHFKYTDYGISNIIENNQVSWRNQNKHISDYFDWQINLLKEYPIKKLLKKFKRKSKQLKSQENQSFANIKENAISILQEMLKPNLWKNDKGENLLLSPAEIIEIINEEQKNKHLKTG